jgi:hypothetical protein
MKENRATKEEKTYELEDIDDDYVSTTSSTNNNNKLLSDETKITCECGICYHKSHKIRHLNSKAHLEELKKKQEPQGEEIEIDDKNDKLKINQNYMRKFKILMVKLLCYIQKFMIVMMRFIDLLTCISVIELMENNLIEMYTYQLKNSLMKIISNIKMTILKN